MAKKLWHAQEAGAAVVVLFPDAGRNTHSVPALAGKDGGTSDVCTVQRFILANVGS